MSLERAYKKFQKEPSWEDIPDRNLTIGLWNVKNESPLFARRFSFCVEFHCETSLKKLVLNTSEELACLGYEANLMNPGFQRNSESAYRKREIRINDFFPKEFSPFSRLFLGEFPHNSFLAELCAGVFLKVYSDLNIEILKERLRDKSCIYPFLSPFNFGVRAYPFSICYCENILAFAQSEMFPTWLDSALLPPGDLESRDLLFMISHFLLVIGISKERTLLESVKEKLESGVSFAACYQQIDSHFQSYSLEKLKSLNNSSDISAQFRAFSQYSYDRDFHRFVRRPRKLFLGFFGGAALICVVIAGSRASFDKNAHVGIPTPVSQPVTVMSVATVDANVETATPKSLPSIVRSPTRQNMESSATPDKVSKKDKVKLGLRVAQTKGPLDESEPYNFVITNDTQQHLVGQVVTLSGLDVTELATFPIQLNLPISKYKVKIYSHDLNLLRTTETETVEGLLVTTRIFE